MVKFPLKKDPFFARERKNYQHPLPSREYILSCLGKVARPLSLAEICKLFSLRNKERQEALMYRISAMVRDGQLLTNRKGDFILVDKSSLVRGLVVCNKEGYGFLIPEDGGEDIFLPANQMRTLLPDDRILVQVINPHKKGRLEGVLVEILERNTTVVVGRYCVEAGVGFVIPSNKRLTRDIVIPEESTGEAKAGQLVAAKIVSYPTKHREAIGAIVEIIGEHMAPGLEIDVAIRTYNLPRRWPEELAAELKNIPQKISAEEISKRRDLRALSLITIDDQDAQDFDDAVYCRKEKNNQWTLFVAIADVSYYVQPNTILDREALARGNSVYFPGRVLPMLPEVLSNNLCSLKPNVDRLCMVCEMTISKNGEIKAFKFYSAIMNSKARMTYTEVSELLANKGRFQHPLIAEIKALHELYKLLDSQRAIRGAISLEKIETKIIFSKDRKIEKILPRERTVAHVIIEECMLAANVCAAKFLLQKKIPALYRCHEQPTAEKLDNLRNFLHGLGLQLGGGENPTPMDFAKIARYSRGRPDEHIIQNMLLRSMRQAVYDEQSLGHFGLAYEAYSHFTSPIRRYPDLLTHRAIKHAISGGTLADFIYDTNAVHNFGEHCSMTERRADEATYHVLDWLKCEYMLDKVGKTFPGIISNVTNFGLFVELKNIYVEGLLHITVLPKDYYVFDAVRYSLSGQRSGRHYKLGDTVKVLVSKVDLDSLTIDFVLPE